MASTNILLIIGAGPRVGKPVAARFASHGYKVALAARSLEAGIGPDGALNIKADLSDPASVPCIFETVEKQWGPPNVVVYNGANRNTTPPEDPFAATLETIDASRRVGFDSAYVAAQESLRRFKQLPSSTPRAFLYTGNALSQIAIPGVMPFAVGKVSAAMMIEYAANAYGKDGHRFYFADERQPDGRPVALSIDGEAHAEMYWDMVNEARQTKWLVTFVKGLGRRDFAGVDFDGNTREVYEKRLEQAS